MAEFALQSLDYMQGTLAGLSQGIGIDMHVRNVSAHVKNALYHTERTPEIDAAAVQLVQRARDFEQMHSGFAMSPAEKDARSKEVELIREAYQTLRTLIAAADPSAVSLALGG